MTTATRNEQYTAMHATEPVLFLAFELSEKPGSSVAPRAMVKSRANGVSPRVIRRACSKKWLRPKDALVSPTLRLW